MFGVGSIPWSPLARGRLCRPAGEKTKRGETDRFQRMYDSMDSSVEIINRCVHYLPTRDVLSRKWLVRAQS